MDDHKVWDQSKIMASCPVEWLCPGHHVHGCPQIGSGAGVQNRAWFQTLFLLLTVGSFARISAALMLEDPVSIAQYYKLPDAPGSNS